MSHAHPHHNNINQQVDGKSVPGAVLWAIALLGLGAITLINALKPADTPAAALEETMETEAREVEDTSPEELAPAIEKSEPAIEKSEPAPAPAEEESVTPLPDSAGI